MPTEKDVQYYEELVRENVADKTISRWLILKDWKDIKIVSLVSTAWWWEDKVDPKQKEKYYVEFCWWRADYSVNYIEETMEILWHEIRPHHLLLRGLKYKPLSFIWWLIKIAKSAEYISRDLSKPFSWQLDSTKIELGKIVESILPSNQDK